MISAHLLPLLVATGAGLLVALLVTGIKDDLLVILNRCLVSIAMLMIRWAIPPSDRRIIADELVDSIEDTKEDGGKGTLWAIMFIGWFIPYQAVKLRRRATTK